MPTCSSAYRSVRLIWPEVGSTSAKAYRMRERGAALIMVGSAACGVSKMRRPKFQEVKSSRTYGS